MSEQHTPRPGEPGYASEPYAADTAADRDAARVGALRRTAPGAPEPGANQAKTEPVAGEGNVSPGTGSYGADHGGTGVGTGQPDRAATGSGGPAAAAGGSGASVGGGTAYRQAQRYGTSPEPIGTDDEAGARAAAPGGPAGQRPAEPTTGADAGATYGLRTEAMPGTSEAAAPAQGVRRAVFEGDAGDDRPGGLDRAEIPVHDRTTGGSGPGSAAAARGESPQPPVEQTTAGSPASGRTDERPVTGVHRRQAPSGEVGSA